MKHRIVKTDKESYPSYVLLFIVMDDVSNGFQGIKL